MENSKKLTQFEEEYYSEIQGLFVKDKDLINVKLNPKFLAYEVYLRRVFGDFISSSEVVDDYDSSAGRKIEKLTKDSLDNNEINKIFEDITNSEFDSNLDSIIKK